MTLLDTFIRPDRAESAQRTEVGRAANLLQVGEFQFLQLAFREWHDEEMPEDIINPMFRAYMLHDQVPFWARHYAHRILALDSRGELDGNDPVWHRYDSDYRGAAPGDVWRFLITAAILVASMSGILWLGHLVAGESASFLPPYFTRQELKDMAKERDIRKTPPAPVPGRQDSGGKR